MLFLRCCYGNAIILGENNLFFAYRATNFNAVDEEVHSSVKIYSIRMDITTMFQKENRNPCSCIYVFFSIGK